MRTSRNFLLAALWGTAALTASLPAVANGGGWGGWHGRGGPAAITMIEGFDTNDDGKVTQAEIDAARKDRLTRFDRDGNGALNLDEYAALWADAMRRSMVRQFQANDRDGDASVTVEEFTVRYENAVRDLDRDGDGELTSDELRRRGRGGRHGPGPDRDDPE
jgi:EF-hand domain pair/EF hand